ncbi:hypothetical protein C8R43DRAFT_909216, partial [Mycena crocata]
SRQEICESLDIFRSYQSGIYHNGGTVKGYLLGGYPARRDAFACRGKLIISHGGGKAEIVRAEGIVKPAEDQRSTDKSVKALLQTYKTGQPLALLIDDKYGLFPFDLKPLGIYMAILGWYRIVHVWAEREKVGTMDKLVVRYKFAFQWVEGQGEPWWFNEPLDGMYHFLPVISAYLYSWCSACGKKSPRVYRQNLRCLNPECQVFWTTSWGGQPSLELEYSPDFLAIIDHRPLPASFQGTLIPPPPVFVPTDGITTTAKFNRGWHCENCGRLSCRITWDKYQCLHCHVMILDRPRFFNCSSRVGQCLTFVLPDGRCISSLCFPLELFLRKNVRGKIHLITMNRIANVEVDKIFVEYQEEGADGTLPFRRWPLRNAMRGTFLSNYYSHNGTFVRQPLQDFLQYVGGSSDTVPLEYAPSAIVKAHKLIEKRISNALNEEHKFNEVLSAAYMEKQHMAASRPQG